MARALIVQSWGLFDDCIGLGNGAVFADCFGDGVAVLDVAAGTGNSDLGIIVCGDDFCDARTDVASVRSLRAFLSRWSLR